MNEEIKKSSAELLADLKPKERKFILALREHGKQGLAAEIAGYKHPDVQGSRLMHREEIQRTIKAFYEEDCKALCISSESIIMKANEMFERCMQHEPVLEFNRATGEWIETGEYKFDSKGAAKALEVIVKVAGLGKEKLEVSGNEGKNFKVDITVIE